MPLEGKYDQYCKKITSESQLQIVEKQSMPAELNRARANPANSSLVACSTANSEISLVNFSDGLVARLAGHTS